jgi:DinB superfamily
MSHADEYQTKLQAHVAGKDPITMQSETPRLIAALIKGRTDAELGERPRSDKWAVTEIIAHLAEDELVSSWRYRQMIENSGCTLPSFDQDQWARVGDYRSWKAADALDMFRLLRDANLRMLERLSNEEWDRFGVHAERGRISVRDLARHMAGHDMNHVDQIRLILSNR